jgi:phage-related protein
MKEAIFHEKALEALRAFPEDARRKTGKAIRDLQRGLVVQMPLSRPMPSVGVGVAEIRAREPTGIYRTFYYLKSKRGVIVFHAFVKKTQKTPQHEIKLARQRLMEMLYDEEK